MHQDSPNTVNSAATLECAEKRRSPRFEADCFVAIHFQQRRIIAACVDYNDGGFGAIVEEEELPVGEILAIELPMSGGVPLKLQAKVVYHEKTRHGFQFVAPEENKRQLIADFFRESAGSAPKVDGCRSIFGHVIRAGACIFCDFRP